MKKIFLSSLMLLMLTGALYAQDTLSDGRPKLTRKQMKEKWLIPPQSKEQLVTVEDQKSFLATEQEMRWFKDAKFGIFIHWGPALLVTNTLSWGRYGERPGAGKQARNGVPPEIYDSAYKQFNPVNFDAERWVRQMQSWGAKYFVFTTKHHDGFCMFDAPNTDYDIMHTPFKRDIAKELADAAHKYGMKIFWYYSQPDWHHPDCLRKDSHYEKYLPYMEEQIRWLLSHYGKIDGMFFDGLGSRYWNWDIKNLIPMMKKLQPGILINPRYGFGLPDMSIRGDYDTPEQGVGPTDAPRYWESCITLTDKWLYNKNAPIKPTNDLIALLVQANGNGGNLLLNLGPNGKGEFVAEEAKQMEGLGRWLKKYGESLYETRRGIYISGDWGTSTQKGNILYLHFLKHFADDAPGTISLPPLPAKVLSTQTLTKAFTKYRVEKEGITFYFDRKKYNENVDNIVALELDQPLNTLDRISTWNAKPVEADELSIKASSERAPKHAAAVILGEGKEVFSEGTHVKSWWQPAAGDDEPWIELTLKEPKSIKTIMLSEQIREYTVRNFSLEVSYADGKTKNIYRGNYIGNALRIQLSGKPVKSVKLLIHKAGRSVKISTFNLYER